jgi:hypothetical protein
LGHGQGFHEEVEIAGRDVYGGRDPQIEIKQGELNWIQSGREGGRREGEEQEEGKEGTRGERGDGEVPQSRFAKRGGKKKTSLSMTPLRCLTYIRGSVRV